MIDIPPIHREARHSAQQQLDALGLTHSAGQIASLAVQLVGMVGRIHWFPSRRATVIFAGDHGITENPQTASLVEHCVNEKAPVNSLSRQMGSRVIIVDAGVNFRFKPRPRSLIPGIGQDMMKPTFVQRKIANGTNDFSQGQAMTEEHVNRAIQLGIDVIRDEQKRGLDMVFLGTIGTGSEAVVQAIISAVIENNSNAHDLLMQYGGYEIASVAGAILQGASQQIPMILDDVTCTAGALIAYQLNPQVANYLIAGHTTHDADHQNALDYLGLTPLFNLGITMGQGTGALYACPLIESAMRLLNEVSSEIH